MEQQMDDMTIELKEGLKLKDLSGPGSQGAEFEVDAFNTSKDGPRDNTCFSPDEVFKNLNYDEDDNGDDGQTQFQRLALKMTDLSGDGGVLKMFIRGGSGVVTPEGALVRVHYNAYLEYSEEPFDSSRLRNEEMKFRLGIGKVIPGWEVAIASMKKDEFARFLIREDYAYGAQGCPPRIPSDATIMYEIDLLSFSENVGLDEFYFLTDEERERVSFTEILKVCNAEKKEGNQYFSSKQFHPAFAKYKKAVHLLETRRLKDADEESQQQKLLLTLYLNLSLCCLSNQRFPLTITYCRKALSIERNNVKALYRIGKAFHQLSDFDRSREYLVRAQRIQPNDKEINEELKRLARDVKNFKFIEKQTCQRMFAGHADKDAKADKPDNSKAASAQSKKNALKCSPEFQALVSDKLQSFCEDAAMSEMPFPSYNLTVPEIGCLLSTAENFGLLVIRRGHEPNIQMTLKKSTNSP